MKQIEKIFLAGFLISFLGSLPPGMMNIIAVQITGEKGKDAALRYASGAMLAEAVIVVIVLAATNWMLKRRKLFVILDWITVVLLGLFAGGCFWAAGSMLDITRFIPAIRLPAFLTGAVISLLNPMHIPFWLGWSSYLAHKGNLSGEKKKYHYLAGIATGTMAGFVVYIYGGQPLFELIAVNNTAFNYTLGALMLIISLMQVRKMAVVPAQVRFNRMLKQQ